MEYLAFGLLGLGAIFILIGILSTRQEKNPVNREPAPVYREKKPSEQPATVQTEKNDFALVKPVPVETPIQHIQPANTPRVVDRIVEKEPAKNSLKNVQITNTNQNALLFIENAVLYFDKSGKNIYDGPQTDQRLLNAAEIHRVGAGKLSFDGFSFFFENKKTKETYKLDEIDKINFYNNCVSLTKKQNGDTSLFFIDNTIRIRALLDHYITTHAPQ